MAGTKRTIEVTVTELQAEWLDLMALKHDLPDRDKALRCVLEHAMSDVEEATLFGVVRCSQCAAGTCQHP